MPETTTDKQVQAARKKVDDLRDKIEAERQKQAAVVSTSENDVRKAALDAEAIRLQAELDAVRAQGKDQTKEIKQVVADVSSPAGTGQTREGDPK